MAAERRDWAWRWSPAVGPIALTLRFASPSRPPLEWFAAQEENPYVEETRGRWRGPTQSERGELLVGTTTSLTFLRSFHEPPPELLAFDARCLLQLIGDALGSFDWSLIDEDYYSYVAAGDDATSLARYLSAPPAELDTHYKALFTPLEIDARTATTPEEALARVGVSFDRWFETHGTHERPRVVHVHASQKLGADWARQIPGYDRLLISIRYG
ncbi:MAG: hypothetical protein QM817_18755 [Archangium sp.]